MTVWVVLDYNIFCGVFTTQEGAEREVRRLRADNCEILGGNPSDPNIVALEERVRE